MIGVILAAGMAKRLRPLTDACPKCLLKIGERTLLQRTVDAMIAAGINELVVVTGYRAEMIREFLTKQYPSLNIHFIHNADYEHNNNIFSLWMTRPYTEGKDFLLSDSDILFDPQLIRAVLTTEGNALALNRHECGEEEIKVIVDDENRIMELSKTFQELEQMIEHEGLIDVFYERAFERLIPQGHTFRIVDTTNFFSIELDTPEDFENAKQLIPAALY